MTGRAEAKRAALRERLVDAAERQIAEGGLAALKARDLAAEAGCALGAIYNVFEDLNALVLAVNGRTFHRLGAAAAASQAGGGDARDRLMRLALAYLDFAAENTALWRALFAFELTRAGEVPAWYRDELERLYSHIGGPLASLYPQEDAEALGLRVRVLFAAVHGIVLLSLENRFEAVPRARIEQMIAILLESVGG